MKSIEQARREEVMSLLFAQRAAQPRPARYEHEGTALRACRPPDHGGRHAIRQGSDAMLAFAQARTLFRKPVRLDSEPARGAAHGRRYG